MSVARQALQGFVVNTRAEFVAADLPALRSTAAKSNEVTDSYLTGLSSHHHLKLETLDGRIKHAAVELIK